jgi:hypothetical protein
MTQAPEPSCPVLFDFFAACLTCAAHMQRLDVVLMDTVKRLSAVRSQASPCMTLAAKEPEHV